MHLTVSTAMKFPPFLFLLFIVRSICEKAPQCLQHQTGKIPFFLSKALSHISTTPLIDWHEKMYLRMSLKSFKAPLQTLLCRFLHTL